MAIYKRCQRVKLETTKNSTSQWLERDRNLRPLDFKSSAVTTLQHCPRLQGLVCVSQKSRKLFRPENFSGLFSGAFLGFQKAFLKAPNFCLIFSGIFSGFVARAVARTKIFQPVIGV